MGWVLFFSLRIPVYKEIQLPNQLSRSRSRSLFQKLWLFPSFFSKREAGCRGSKPPSLVNSAPCQQLQGWCRPLGVTHGVVTAKLSLLPS